MQERWSQLEAWIDAHAPAFASTLRPPASAAEIDAAEAQLDVTLPPSVRRSYRIHDGDTCSWYGVLGYGLLPLSDLVGTAETLREIDGDFDYDFWGDAIARSLRETADRLGTDTLLNCASQEYFGAVEPAALCLRIITPIFLEDRNGEAKTVSFFAKRARGAMARFVVERRLRDPAGLLEFDSGGYAYDSRRSQPDAPAFVRSYPDE